jgi:hypothetical protein
LALIAINKENVVDDVTNTFAFKLSSIVPRKAIRLTHQFLDGEDGRECGFVPNDHDGSYFLIEGKWWD